MPVRAPTRFHTLVLPAIIAQSMIIGGGYATGREVVEYAGRFGNWGWLSVAIITVCFAVVMALSFELARLAGAYDYKTWSRNLVGPFWLAGRRAHPEHDDAGDRGHDGGDR